MLDAFVLEIQATYSGFPDIVAHIHTAVGNAYLGLGDHGKAGKQFAAALEIRRRLYGSSHELVAGSLIDRAQFERSVGEADAAARTCQEALSILRTLSGEHDFALIRAEAFLTELLRERGDATAAGPILADVRTRMQRMFGGDNPECIRVLLSLAGALYAGGDVGQAATLVSDALASERKLYGDDDPKVRYLEIILMVFTAREVGSRDADNARVGLCRRRLERNPNDVETLAELARLWLTKMLPPRTNVLRRWDLWREPSG